MFHKALLCTRTDMSLYTCVLHIGHAHLPPQWAECSLSSPVLPVLPLGHPQHVSLSQASSPYRQAGTAFSRPSQTQQHGGGEEKVLSHVSLKDWYMCSSVLCSFIYGGQEIEMTKVSFDRWLDKKMWYIYIMEYYSAIRNDVIGSFATT